MEEKRVKFEIDQLRKDKIIYAVEACAINLVCILGYFLSKEFFVSPTVEMVNVLLGLTGVGYSLYMGVGNLFRLMKIRRLEKEMFG